MMKDTLNLKPLPLLLSDADAEAFVDTADLTEYDLSGFKPVRLETLAKRAKATSKTEHQINTTSSR